MYIFWENVFRFPRFFITSVSGLIVILLTPFWGGVIPFYLGVLHKSEYSGGRFV